MSENNGGKSNDEMMQMWEKEFHMLFQLMKNKFHSRIQLTMLARDPEDEKQNFIFTNEKELDKAVAAIQKIQDSKNKITEEMNVKKVVV